MASFVKICCSVWETSGAATRVDTRNSHFDVGLTNRYKDYGAARSTIGSGVGPSHAGATLFLRRREGERRVRKTDLLFSSYLPAVIVAFLLVANSYSSQSVTAGSVAASIQQIAEYCSSNDCDGAVRIKSDNELPRLSTHLRRRHPDQDRRRLRRELALRSCNLVAELATLLKPSPRPGLCQHKLAVSCDWQG